MRTFHREEAGQARTMGGILATLSLVTLGFLPFIGGELWLRLITGTTLFLFASVGLSVARVARSPRAYTPRWFRLFGVSAVITSLVLQYHLGVFSPTPLAVTLGISFFGRGADRRWAIGICVSAIVGYFVLTGLVIAGVLPDAGVFNADNAPLWGRLFMLLIVPAVFSLTLFQARVQRRSLEAAVNEVAAGERRVQRQVVVVDELQQRLEEVAGRRAVKQGHYTGHTIGRWTLHEVLGRGATAEVYAAEDERSGTRAALKVLYGHLASEPTQLARFEREGLIAASLRSPYLVKILDVGISEDGAAYLAMEHLKGEDLASLLQADRPLSLSDAGELLQQLGTAIDVVHEAGVLHRDIKPANIFRVEQPGGGAQWKLLDFGLGKLLDGQGTLTQGDLIGTPAYMPPEQATGDSLDRTADLYALGAVVYRAVTGHPPFRGRGVVALLQQVLSSRPLRPTQLRTELPADIDAVLSLAMAPDTADRFRSGAELASAWQAACGAGLPSELRQRAEQIDRKRPWAAE